MVVSAPIVPRSSGGTSRMTEGVTDRGLGGGDEHPTPAPRTHARSITNAILPMPPPIPPTIDGGVYVPLGLCTDSGASMLAIGDAGREWWITRLILFGSVADCRLRGAI
jgi:hypothetical protein